ncbi:hypothetical protein ELI87_21955 [Klebsiella pneumoniae]|nr:hypothetical protein [Klebsiella pneumoniae]MBL2212281.1 hypothetical protein [Klebsiella pneumoniae]MBL2229725.1 hypothetical protein [Klebsiella pneumoniae]MBL2258214.1 hypothetical protein [Klebsiella pneumoniae]
MASSGTTSNTMRFTGAQLVVHLLERQGITMVSGIPGGSILPIYDALSQSTQIRHILARHEQGAGFIAQGMARTEGKPAVCMACSGPGATNLVTAIADARLDSIPLVCITGQVPASMIGTDAFQEVDTYGISIPITKHNYLVRDIAELPQVISDAFRIAQSGRPGPVWIDIPKDVPYNYDHPLASHLAQEARIIAQAEGYRPGEKIVAAPPVYCFEPHQPEQCNWKPDVLLDITAVWEKKYQAIQCMQGQEHLWEYYTRVALQRGVQAKRNIGITAARDIVHGEAFQSIFPRVTENLA